MTSSYSWLVRQIAALLVFVLTVSMCQSEPAWSQQQAASERRPQGASSQDRASPPSTTGPATAASELPDNPEPVGLLSDGQPQATDQNAQSANTEPAATQQQNSAQQPLGTAAAPYERTMGVAASRPAGAAIAPAKQRRVRTILISVGVIVGAGVAIGTVAGLSRASSSRP